MFSTIKIQAGYQRGGNFYETNTPWYTNIEVNFDKVLAQVESGLNEFGEHVEFDSRTEVVRVSEIERNGAYGKTIRQVDVLVN